MRACVRACVRACLCVCFLITLGKFGSHYPSTATAVAEKERKKEKVSLHVASFILFQMNFVIVDDVVSYCYAVGAYFAFIPMTTPTISDSRLNYYIYTPQSGLLQSANQRHQN